MAETQQGQQRYQPVSKLNEQVISELDLLTTLNISRSTLDGLRNDKGFPVARLTLQARVYLIDAVLEWIKKQAR